MDMTIESTKDEIIFRLPVDTDIDLLQDIADWLAFKEITRKSKAKQKDVDKLVAEIKKGRWQRTKDEIGL